MSTARNDAETLHSQDSLWSSLLDQAGEVWLTLPDPPAEPAAPLSPVVPLAAPNEVREGNDVGEVKGDSVVPTEVTCDDEDVPAYLVESPVSAAECPTEDTLAASDWDDDELEFIDESWLDLAEDESSPSPAPSPSIPIRGHHWKVGEVLQRLRWIAERAGGVTIHQLVGAVERLGGDEYSVARVAEELAERGIGVLERPKHVPHDRWLALSQSSAWRNLAEQAFAHLPRIHPTWHEVASRLGRLADQPLPAAVKRSLYEAYLAHQLSRQEEQALFARLERLRREYPDLAPQSSATLDDEPLEGKEDEEDESTPLAPASDAHRREDSRLVQWRNLPEVRQIYATLCVDQLWMVARTALMYRCATVDYEDLYQEGCVGLLRAIDLFDVRQGFRFQTYAQHWVRQHIYRAVVESGLVRIPSHVSERYRRVQHVEAELEQRLGRLPTSVELATELGIKPAIFSRIHHLRQCLSLEQTPEAYEVADPRFAANSPPDMRWHVEKLLDKVMAELGTTSRNRDILKMRLDPESHYTLEEIGEQFGVTRERVRQIEDRVRGHVKGGRSQSAHELRELAGYQSETQKRQRAVVPEPGPLLDPELTKQAARWRERRLKRERRLEARIVAFTDNPVEQEILRLRRLRRPPLSALAVRHRLRLPLAEVKHVEAAFERFVAEQPSAAEPAEPQPPPTPAVTLPVREGRQPQEQEPDKDLLFLEECITSYTNSPVIQEVLRRRLLHTPTITQEEASQLSGFSLDDIQWFEKNFSTFAMKRMRRQEGGR